MEIWIMIAAPIAGLIFLIDYLLRRKKWKANTLGEKTSLIINMVSVLPYMIMSAAGFLLGITGNGTNTPFGDLVYRVTIGMAGIYFIIAIAALVGSLILRKIGKTKWSIWINVIAIAYIAVVILVNYLAGELL